MHRTSTVLVVGGIAAALVLPLGPAVAGGRDSDRSHGHRHGGTTAVGLAGDTLVAFSTKKPSQARAVGKVSGLTGDTRLVGIGHRVQDGRLSGVGDRGGVYTIAGKAVAIKVSQLTVALSGSTFGVDSNPAADRLEEHLDGCASCTAELGELTPVAAALVDLRVCPAGATGGVPPALADRVVGAVDQASRAERRTSWARTAGVAGVAAALTLVLSLGVQALREDPTPTTPSVPTEAVGVRDEAPGVQASAALVNHTRGVEVRLHANGFEDGGRYRVDVLGTGGRRFPAGEFVGTGAREMDCNLDSSVLRDRAAGVEVTDSDGRVVAASTFG